MDFKNDRKPNLTDATDVTVQVALNYRTKSTSGFSIGTALYDFTGGLLSIAQQILDGVLMHDFSAVTGSPVKFGLGLISLFYDIAFMIQHFILYPDGNKGMQPLLNLGISDGASASSMAWPAPLRASFFMYMAVKVYSLTWLYKDTGDKGFSYKDSMVTAM